MNRASRRKREREVKKMLKTGVGAAATLAGYRVVRADGSIKHQAGQAPNEPDTEQGRERHDSQ